MRPENGHTLRNLFSASIGTGGGKLLGSNPRRTGLILSAPASNAFTIAANSNVANDVDTSITGVKVSYSVPTGKQSMLTSASVFVNAGTPPTSQLQLVGGGQTIVLASFTGSGNWLGQVPLNAGNAMQWNVTAAGAGSNCDFMIGIMEEGTNARLTLSFINPPVLDTGVNLYMGANPLILTPELLGDSIEEEIWGISSSGTLTITGVEFFR